MDGQPQNVTDTMISEGMVEVRQTGRTSESVYNTQTIYSDSILKVWPVGVVWAESHTLNIIHVVVISITCVHSMSVLILDVV